MLTFKEVLDRARTGPLTSEKEFNLRNFSRKISEVVEKYEIEYDSENPIPDDNGLADDIFEAGIELVADVGALCTDNERIINFSEEEIQEALNDAPTGQTFGEGKDAKKLVAREPETSDPPWCWLGACGGGVSSEKLLLSLAQGYASIPEADSITIPNIRRVDGRDVQGGTPWELFASIRTVTLAREALRRTQRPGLPIMNSICSAVSDMGKIGGAHFGVRPSDGMLIGMMAPMQIDYERLNEVAYTLAIGGNVVGETSPMLGGYCRGPEGTAVANVAYHILSILLLRGSCQLTFPINTSSGGNTERNMLWVISASSQAISRNSHFPFLTTGMIASGPMTETCFYEIAAKELATVVSGSSMESNGIAKGRSEDRLTPMEPKFSAKVGNAVAGMKRKKANNLVKELLERYEDKLDNPSKGKKYQECYDIQTITPSQEYQDLYEETKEELEDIGIEL